MQGARFTPMSFVGARSSYYLMLGGMALSVLALLAEVTHDRLTSNRVDAAAADENRADGAEKAEKAADGATTGAP